MNPIRKILLFLPALDMSGASFSALNLVAGFRQNGVQVMVLALEGGEREPLFRRMGAEVVLARHAGRHLLGRGVSGALEAFAPDILHVFSCSILRRACRLLRGRSIPIVLTINRLECQSRDILAKNPGIGIIALSDAIRAHLVSHVQVPRERIAVIPSGIDLGMVPRRNLQSTVVRSSCHVVGTYGTFVERKGQRTFIQAAATLIRGGMNVEFLLMGQGPDKAVLRGLGRELGISNRLTFTPSTASDLDSLCNIDLFVEPSLQEGFGLSVLQAMATGLPVIACGVGGIYSLVDDRVTGILVPAGDAGALAGAMRELLGNPALCEELSSNARAKVEKEFAAPVICRRLLAYYADRRAEGMPASPSA